MSAPAIWNVLLRNDPLQQLHAVAAHLPFALDDYDEAGVTFARWREKGDDKDKRTVQLWSYCYVQRYFFIRFLRERTTTPSDLDAVISGSYERILKNLETVREPLRFAAFVSVVCKRALLNHRARRRDVVEPEDHFLQPDEADAASVYDGTLIRKVVEEALETLPDSIRRIAKWRILDNKDYEWIADQTKRPVATVRTYVSKALVVLRGNERLRSLHFEDLLPPMPPTD